MTINKVEIVCDKHGTTVKLNDMEELQGVNFINFRVSEVEGIQLSLGVDVIPNEK